MLTTEAVISLIPERHQNGRSDLTSGEEHVEPW